MRILYICILSLLSCSLIASCSRDEHGFNYFLKNPEAIQIEVKKCQENHKEGSSCKQLESYQQQIATAKLSAQSNPQDFGLQLMKLQGELEKLQHDNKQPQTRLAILQLEHKIHFYLSIIRWLESPEI